MWFTSEKSVVSQVIVSSWQSVKPSTSLRSELTCEMKFLIFPSLHCLRFTSKTMGRHSESNPVRAARADYVTILYTRRRRSRHKQGKSGSIMFSDASLAAYHESDGDSLLEHDLHAHICTVKYGQLCSCFVSGSSLVWWRIFFNKLTLCLVLNAM